MPPTSDPPDISSVARAVARLEQVIEKQDARLREQDGQLDRLERYADRAEGAMTIVKFGISLLGIGGVAAILAFFAKGGSQ